LTGSLIDEVYSRYASASMEPISKILADALRTSSQVETIGDCYVAVTGLPRPRPDHAIQMARFAMACMEKFQVLTKKLEVELGPDTADLQ
jgi:class 3 adenylate cyclase